MIFSKFYQCRHVVLCCVLCLPTLMMEGILCPTPTKHRHIDWRHHIHHVDTDIYIFLKKMIQFNVITCISVRH